MRHVHGEATECVAFMGRQRNAHVHREGLDGIGDGNKDWRTAQRRKRTSYVQNGVLLIGRGLAYRKKEETDLLQSKRGPVDREGCGVPQNGRNGPPTVETGVLLIGRGVAYRKTDLCWSATVETGVLLIGRGVAYRKTGFCGILFVSSVDLL